MRHVPVLLNEVIDVLQLRKGMNIVDCTLGDGGHAEAILEKIKPNGKLLGIDADPESLLRAKQYLYPHQEQIIFVRDNFSALESIVQQEQFGPVHGILIDLGWSSPQFAERGRGFSFQHPDEPLDMRYTPNGPGQTAAEFMSHTDEQTLITIFSEYGEENLSKEIAHEIIEVRKETSIETVGDLVDIVLSVYRKKLKTDKEIPWIGGLHPATKVFQALRIAVNDELGVLKTTLPQAVRILAPGGRLAVISFHSLEDRIVKHFFKQEEGTTLTITTKKPVIASEKEYADNPPSRSAKLRVIEKL